VRTKEAFFDENAGDRKTATKKKKEEKETTKKWCVDAPIKCFLYNDPWLCRGINADPVRRMIGEKYGIVSYR